MIKTCNTCKLEKLQSEFRKDKSTKDGYRHNCKVCARTYHQSKYITNYGEKTRERQRKAYTTVRAKLNEYKLGKACICCGEDEPACLDFHHLDPNEKDFTVTQSMNRKWESILAEIQKCVVLCANCHRKVHANLITLTEGDYL